MKFQSTCPACGAPFEWQSSASVFAVCAHCHTGISRLMGVLESTGEVSHVLEDYSPLQVGSHGTWDGKPFTLVGRIQLAYDGGFWNEWFVRYANGSSGWLADASGQLAIMAKETVQGELPGPNRVTPGKQLHINGQAYIASDCRTARCVGAQGELPFAVSERWEGHMVDLRRADELLTLDYSDEPPALYRGTSVSLNGLGLEFLRDADSIKQSAGRLKGKLESLSCPSCGSSIKAIAGATFLGHCAQCGSTLDVTGKTAQLIEKGNSAHARTNHSFLRAGDTGVLNGKPWTVLGVVVQKSFADGEHYSWTDYLLYNPKSGFCWLSESHADGSWLLVHLLDTWPTELSSSLQGYQVASFELSDSYKSTVDKVWGSFNWRIHQGDTADCEEYRVKRASPAVPAGSLLVQETTTTEQTWSLCTPLKATLVATAFGKAKPVLPKKKLVAAEADEGFPLAGLLKLAAGAHGLVWLLAPTFAGLIIGLITLALLWVLTESEQFE